MSKRPRPLQESGGTDEIEDDLEGKRKLAKLEEQAPGLSLPDLMRELHAIIAGKMSMRALSAYLRTSRLFGQDSFVAYIYREFCRTEWVSPLTGKPYRMFANFQSVFDAYLAQRQPISQDKIDSIAAKYWRAAYAAGAWAIRLVLAVSSNDLRLQMGEDTDDLLAFAPFDLGEDLDSLGKFKQATGSTRADYVLRGAPGYERALDHIHATSPPDQALNVAGNNWLVLARGSGRRERIGRLRGGASFLAGGLQRWKPDFGDEPHTLHHLEIRPPSDERPWLHEYEYIVTPPFPAALTTRTFFMPVKFRGRTKVAVLDTPVRMALPHGVYLQHPHEPLVITMPIEYRGGDVHVATWNSRPVIEMELWTGLGFVDDRDETVDLPVYSLDSVLCAYATAIDLDAWLDAIHSTQPDKHILNALSANTMEHDRHTGSQAMRSMLQAWYIFTREADEDVYHNIMRIMPAWVAFLSGPDEVQRFTSRSEWLSTAVEGDFNLPSLMTKSVTPFVDFQQARH